MARYQRREPTDGELAEKEHANAKRRSVIGMECAASIIRLAMGRFLNPRSNGEPGELDRWIICHMSDADFHAAGYSRFAKPLAKARDAAAIALGALSGSADSLN